MGQGTWAASSPEKSEPLAQGSELGAQLRPRSKDESVGGSSDASSSLLDRGYAVEGLRVAEIRSKHLQSLTFLLSAAVRTGRETMVERC